MAGFLQLALDFLAPIPAGLPPPGRPAPQRPPPTSGDTALPAGVREPGAVGALSRHPLTHPKANRECVLGGARVGYELQRVRRRSIGLVVGAEGLCVRAPRWVPQFEIDAALQERANWILRRLDDARHRLDRLEAVKIEWADGARFAYLGGHLCVRLSHGLAPPEARATSRRARAWLQAGAADEAVLHLDLPPHASAEQLRDAAQAWLMEDAQNRFRERLEHFAPKLGVRWTRLRLSNAGTRWGSAQSDGTIRLNWRLIHFRQEVIDYVVVHELSHLRVMDHSPRFWDTVASVMPDYAQHRQVLKSEVLPAWGG